MQICKSDSVVDRGREPGKIKARRSTGPGLERKRRESERMRTKSYHHKIDIPMLAPLL